DGAHFASPIGVPQDADQRIGDALGGILDPSPRAALFDDAPRAILADDDGRRTSERLGDDHPEILAMRRQDERRRRGEQREFVLASDDPEPMDLRSRGDALDELEDASPFAVFIGTRYERLDVRKNLRHQREGWDQDVKTLDGVDTAEKN